MYGPDYAFRFAKADTVREGAATPDVAILATGVCVANALAAAETLATEGLDVRVINVHTVKPLDEEAVLQAARDAGAIVTAENHNIIGGLGDAVASVLSEHNPTPLERVGVKDHFGQVGKMDYLLEALGLTPAHIAQAARRVIARKA